MKELFKAWNKLSLVVQIAIGLVIGIILALTVPTKVAGITIFGTLFVGALKGVAPVLVFFLVMSAISQHKTGHEVNYRIISCGNFCGSMHCCYRKLYLPTYADIN